MKKSKIIWNRMLRMAVIGMGAAVGVAGGVMAYRAGRPYEESVEVPLVSYSMTVESSYRVHMPGNSLYEGEWLEEGALYARALTDYVEVRFAAGAALAGEAQASGEYTVTAILEGYQMRGDVKRVIYDKTYDLESGRVKEAESGNISMEKTIRISPADYAAVALEAEEILGASTSKDFRVEFAGSLVIEGEEKPFSCLVSIPVSEENFYEITKTEPLTENGVVSHTSAVTVTPGVRDYLPYIGICILGVAASLLVILLTRGPREEEELWEEKLRVLMRRYGSRCISLESFPEEGKREELRIGDMNSLIAVAEELRCPITCCLNEKGLPREGKFCVFNDRIIYILQIKKSEE